MEAYLLPEVLFKKEKKKYRTPQFQLVTTQELENLKSKATRLALKNIVFPPMLSPRKEISETLEVNEDIKFLGLTGKYIFTDITYGSLHNDRFIVVRDTSTGVLRKATWDERDRMLEIYFPKAKQYRVPAMLLHAEYFNNLLKKRQYLFLLDRLCLQYEPNDENFIKRQYTIFEEINTLCNFNDIISTRHYPCLLFYLAMNNNIDNVLEFFLDIDSKESVSLLLNLYFQIQNLILKQLDLDEKTDSVPTTDYGENVNNLLEGYIKMNPKSRVLNKVDLFLNQQNEDQGLKVDKEL